MKLGEKSKFTGKYFDRLKHCMKSSMLKFNRKNYLVILWYSSPINNYTNKTPFVLAELR